MRSSVTVASLVLLIWFFSEHVFGLLALLLPILGGAIFYWMPKVFCRIEEVPEQEVRR